MSFRKVLFMLFVITLSSYLPCYSTKLSEILNTTQPALLIHVSDIQITSKVLLDESPCSIFMSETSSTSDSSTDFMTLATLYVPPPRIADDAAARLLLVRQGLNQSKPGLEYNFVDIPFPAGEADEMGKSKISSIDFKPFPMPGGWNFTGGKLSATLYDNINGYLYLLLLEDSQRTTCYVFTPKFEGRSIVDDDFRYKFVVHPSFTNTSWSSDSYRQLFHYHAKSGERSPTVVYAIPFPEIFESLREGRHGKLVASSQKGGSIQISRDLTYISISSKPGFSSVNSSVRERCTSFAGNLPQNADFIFGLFGWEYCKLRHTTKQDRKLCLEAFVDDRSRGKPFMVTWYHVVISIIFILAVIVATLCFVRYRILREKSRKADEENRAALTYRSSESFDFTL